MTKKQTSSRDETGSILVTILIVTIFLTLFTSSLILLANANVTRARNRLLLLQAQYAAESGADAAIAILNSGNEAYAGTISDVQVQTNAQYKSTYAVTVSPGASSKERKIVSTGKLYSPKNSASPTMTRRIEVISQRTSTSIVTSGVISRNIVYLQSGVKNLYAKDMYLNGFLLTAKNTTNVIAENLTIAGKNTGAGNCSIEGTGNLIKPTTFTTAGQTKTNLTLAYNNCINPPGNTTNANFNVNANVSGLPKIQSTYIPYNQYMDSSYTNSPGGCSDWTTGASPRSIPSAGNTKKTHYPDTQLSISALCGTSGDVNLGNNTYIIRDHVHIRANLCAASGCTPTFTNPDSGESSAKYIFVEGTVNFNGVHSTPGSGPIVLVVYGADPASKSSVCPYGGAVYLGNTGTVAAPGIYFLANNGLCLDNTKFDGVPNFGGLSGKNIYISSSPGSPFDLTLDTTFPISIVPIDLAWKATFYRRL